MSRTAWRKSATTDVLFPDDLAGYGPVCVVGEPLEAEEAETDTVEYGVLARLAEGFPEEYLVAPKAVRALIADAWRDDDDLAYFEVLEAEKDGEEEHAEWSIEARILEDGDPV